MGTIKIEKISKSHLKMIKNFLNQEESLVFYLQRLALRHAQDQLSTTWVALDNQQNQDCIAGYFTLCTTSVDRLSVNTIPVLSHLPNYPIPAVLLARLAVDERVQGQRLGTRLLQEALALTFQNPIAARLMATDAISEDAIKFYHKNGFTKISTSLPARMILDLKPLKSLLGQSTST